MCKFECTFIIHIYAICILHYSQSWHVQDHYFGVFWKERCVLIIKPNTEFVIDTLTENNNNRKDGATTNLNSVVVNLGDTSKYEVAFKDEVWFEKNS